MKNRKIRCRRAVAFLEQGCYARDEVENILQQIDNLRAMAGRVSASFGKERISQSSQPTAMEDAIVRITVMEEELKKRIENLMQVQQEIGKVLDQVPDALCRIVLEKKYLLGKSYEEIQDEMKRTSRWVYERRREGIEMVENILRKGKENFS